MAGNELKPVHCGCGGEPIIQTDHDTVVPGEPIDWKRVICDNCSIRTTWRHTEAEAITAWNKAMGATDMNVGVKFATDTNVGDKERTAKVENIEVEFGDDEYVHDRMGDMYCYGDCGNCGQTVSHNQKYCHECGAKLEWE